MLADWFVSSKLTEQDKTLSERAERIEMRLNTLAPVLRRCCSSQVQPTVCQVMTGIETNHSAGGCSAFFTLKTRGFGP
jgi:hypothetical protein